MGLFIDILKIINIVIWLVVFWALSDAAWEPSVIKILTISGVALNLFVMVLERRRRDYY